MLETIFVSTFATVCLFTIGLTMKGETALIRDRMATLRLLVEQDIEAVLPEMSTPLGERVIRPWLRRLAGVFSRFLPANSLANAAAKLEQAGCPWRLKPAELIGLKILSVLVFSLAGILFFAFVDTYAVYRVLTLVTTILVGFLLPSALLERTIGERRRLIRKSLADCLDLLVVCTEAGLGFDGALARVVEQMRGPLADEFRRVLQELSIGRPRVEALRAMAGRAGVPELTTFVAAVHQSDLLGVSIAHVLRVQADSVRTRRHLSAREHAAKLPVKMLFPLVFFVFPAIFVIMLGPSAIQIYRAISSAWR